jgi:hypothetical protein
MFNVAVVLCTALVPQLSLRRGVSTAVWRRTSYDTRAPIYASSFGAPQDDLVEPPYETRGTDPRVEPPHESQAADRRVLRASNVVPLAVSVVYSLRPDVFDGAVQSGWAALCSIDTTRSPMFEAEVAAGSFVTWIILWSSVHLVMGQRAKVHRFDGKMPHDPFSWLRPGNWHEALNPIASYLGSIYLCARESAQLAAASPPALSRECVAHPLPMRPLVRL